MKDTPLPPPARRPFQAPRAIFWVGFVLRVATILIGHTYRIRIRDHHFDFGFEMGRIAQSLVLGHGYADPFDGLSGPTAWELPLYPLLMALAFKLFGIYSNTAALFLMVVNSALSAAIAPAIYEIAARCFDAQGIARRTSRKAAPVALWSAWLWAAYPAAMQYAVHWIWEMSLSTLLFTWTIVLALRMRGVGEASRETRRAMARWACFGLLWGLLALSNATLLLCLPAQMLWATWPQLRARTSMARAISGMALAAALLCVVIAPWVLRNQRTLHAFIPTRANFGVELYNSTLPQYEGLPWGTAMPLWPGDPEFQRYVRMGEVAYACERGGDARERILAHPGFILRSSMNRFFYFWDGVPHAEDRHPAQEYLRNLSYSFLSVCGLLGLALALRRRVHGALLFALVFLLVPLPYYAVTVQARFRHPLEPLIAVLAVYLFRSTERKGVEGSG